MMKKNLLTLTAHYGHKKTDNAMRRILLLEDDADTRDWFSDLLGKAFGDATIIHAESIKQAAALLDEHEFNLGIIDIYLPDAKYADDYNVLAE